MERGAFGAIGGEDEGFWLELDHGVPAQSCNYRVPHTQLDPIKCVITTGELQIEQRNHAIKLGLWRGCAVLRAVPRELIGGCSHGLFPDLETRTSS